MKTDFCLCKNTDTDFENAKTKAQISCVVTVSSMNKTHTFTSQGTGKLPKKQVLAENLFALNKQINSSV